jgi:hypothetical protein
MVMTSVIAAALSFLVTDLQVQPPLLATRTGQTAVLGHANAFLGGLVPNLA